MDETRPLKDSQVMVFFAVREGHVLRVDYRGNKMWLPKRSIPLAFVELSADGRRVLRINWATELRWPDEESVAWINYQSHRFYTTAEAVVAILNSQGIMA